VRTSQWRHNQGFEFSVGVVANDMPVNVKEFSGLAADSRDVRPGFLFAALAGTKGNGAEYIADAVARGAVAVLGPPEAEDSARAANVRFIADRNPRARLAHMAAEFYGAQPNTIAAVTGTNGKTSVVEFVRQIWTHMSIRAASMGTVGIVEGGKRTSLAHTTPDPIALHRELARLKQDGVEHVALEASSHGLDQHRLDGVNIDAAAFTNITRDHMDYHPDFAHYLASKLRLIDRVKRGGAVVVNVDARCGSDFTEAAEACGHRVFTVGTTGYDIRLDEQVPQPHGQRLRLSYDGREYIVTLSLAGAFQASNALVAAGLCIALGHQEEDVFAALEGLRGAPGRLELVARARSGAPIYIDYAHTPDALEVMLQALRPHVPGHIHMVFGCGGDRDRGKRPLMGEAAARLADRVIVTDDNPRSEDPAAIRREIMPECHGAREIGDRAEAIRAAIAELGERDALVIAGKGHEEGQIVGAEVRPFSDRAAAIAAATDLGGAAT
jgi:UDP-N-acetylmuramoyl-L-alanyl-D-glutamate--2,6-diaminopimelate ligase